MNASELFKAGKLQEAIAAQTQEVKAHPADHSRRLFLFELLAFAGDLERARRQIDAIKYDEMELETAVLSYRRLLDAEAARRRVFGEGQKAHFLAQAPDHAHFRLQALGHLRENRPAEAKQLLEQADSLTPPVRGKLNGKAFDTLRDCDDRLGGVLEVMAHGEYYWVPLEQVQSLTVKEPKFPRDLLWLPARLEMEGATGDVFLPALYPGSHEHADDAVKLGRTTDWQQGPDGPVLGLGLRTFLVGEEGINLPDWRELQTGEGG